MHTKTKRKARKQLRTRTLKGGLVYGTGTFGAILGDPSLPYLKPKVRNVISLLGESASSRSLSSKSKKVGTINPWNYVSKVFYHESDIADVHKYMDILSEVSHGNVNNIFGRYLVLPLNVKQLGFQLPIDTARYLSPEFQSNKYWTKKSNDTVDRESRDKLQSNKYMVLYPKAICDVHDISLDSIDKFEDFIHNFRNVVAGISKLHSLDVVHHDLKPLNFLVLGHKSNTSKQHYKISDLDSMKLSHVFTNESDEHVDRLLVNWGYNYFPASVTLLASIIKSQITHNSKVDLSESDRQIKLGLKYAKTQEYFESIQTNNKEFIENLKRNLPRISDELIAILHEININKFGVSSFNDRNLTDGGSEADPQKMKTLSDINRKIIGLLTSDPELSIIDKNIILVKYVDIYSLGQSLLEMTQKFITSSHESLSDAVMLVIEHIFELAHKLLTYKYFEEKLYKVDLLKLYDSMVLRKSAESKSKSSRE